MYKISSEFDYKQKNTEEMIQGKSQLFSVDFFFTNKKNARHRGIKFQSCKWTPIGPMLISGTNIDGKDTGNEGPSLRIRKRKGTNSDKIVEKTAAATTVFFSDLMAAGNTGNCISERKFQIYRCLGSPLLTSTSEQCPRLKHPATG